jgi:hypothetical protein
MPDVDSEFQLLPAQAAFWLSDAKILGYGGAMGGGKTRCLCEWVFEHCLGLPGLKGVLARFAHTSIIESTRKIMLEQVLPPSLIAHKKESGGEDYIRLTNGSEIHFIGLSDPVKQFSTEVGIIGIDEAHEVPESAVLLLNTRNRQRCKTCIQNGTLLCDHFPHRIALAFNPENPGHYLYQWFFLAGAVQTTYGRRKEQLFPTNATRSLGTAEFFFANARDNPYLDPEYVNQNLAGLPELLRRRYLEGEWLYVSGQPFFDIDAIAAYDKEFVKPPKVMARSHGDPTGADNKDLCRLKPDRQGGWWVWEPPIRSTLDDQGNRLLPARYLLAVDVAQGSANDYSAVQVLRLDTLEQVAEFQGQIDTAELAIEVARVGRVYNVAEVAVEKTGGWGWAVISDLEKFKYPRLYTKTVYDRLQKQWTDKLGFDTTVYTRAEALNTLEQLTRDFELKLRSSRCLAEMATFVWPERRRQAYGQSGPFDGIPQAQPGCNDDLVLALAIGVTVALKRPRRRTREQRRERYTPELVTGY